MGKAHKPKAASAIKYGNQTAVERRDDWENYAAMLQYAKALAQAGMQGVTEHGDTRSRSYGKGTIRKESDG